MGHPAHVEALPLPIRVRRHTVSVPRCFSGVWLKGADAVGRYAHIQAQAGEKGERPWAAFEVDVSDDRAKALAAAAGC